MVNLSPDEELRKLVSYQDAIRAVELLDDHIKDISILTEIEIETYKNIAQEYSKDMFFFCKYVLGFNKISEPHKRWIDKLVADLFVNKNTIRLKPRGTYKTTIYGVGFILWSWALLSKKIRFLYASANQGLLDEVSSEIRRYLDLSLYSLIFDIKMDETEKNTNYVMNINGREGKGFSLTLKTSGSSTAGLHPHFIIVDDPSDEKDRASRAIREAKYRWADTLVPLLVPIDLCNLVLCHQMFIATRWHMEDVIHYLEEKNKRLQGEDRFDMEVEAVIDEHGNYCFPEIHGEKEVEYLKLNLPSVNFSCQYMNKPLPEGSQIFDMARLHFRDNSEIDITKGINYCFLDPSKGKKESDYPATIFVNFQNDKIFIFDAIDTKIILADLLLNIVRRAKQYKCHSINYEDNGSNLIDNELKRLLKLEDYNCLINGRHETRNKHDRIVNSQPTLYSGKVLFRSDYSVSYPELMNQVVYYPAWGNDDFPDVIEKSIDMVFAEKKVPRARVL